jgi:hypothetical protein
LLPERVEILEEKVQGLDVLPARIAAVESQIVQLRDGLGAESSAIRREVAEMLRELGDALRSEICAGDEETRRCMQVLHEDLVSRIALLREARRPHGKRR